MTETKIDKFFTPATPRSVKRQRPDTTPPGTVPSPDMAHDDDKVGSLTRGQLKDDLSRLLDEKLTILVSSLASKADLEVLSGQVARLTEENVNLKEEILALKAQEKSVVNKLVDLESRSRRNNLIFKGLKWNVNTRDYKAVVEKFCKEVLGAEESIWINRAHPLGKDGKSIIAHFPTDADIDYLMSRVRRLKGTGFVVHRDFPSDIRQKRSCLMSVRAEVERVAGRRKMPLIFDHIIIDGCRFTWEDGRLRAGRLDGADKLKSLYNHDFSEFLTTLSNRDPGGRGPRTQASTGGGGGGVAVTTATPGRAEAAAVAEQATKA